MVTIKAEIPFREGDVEMYNYILSNFKGSVVTVAFKGIPAVVTGEVLSSGYDNIIALRIQGGQKIFINADLIAFVY